MEREKTKAELHAQRQSFILKRIQEGAHEKQPENISQGNWERAVNIGVAYNFGGEPLEVLGDQYEISRERASKIVKKFLLHLRYNSSEELQSSHPLEDLLSKRPASEIFKQRMSQASGGTSLRVKEQVVAGATSIEEIKRNTGISRSSIYRSLPRIRGWGIDVMHLQKDYENKKKIEQLKKEEDDKKIQQILDELPPNVILANLVKRKLRYNAKIEGIFITVGNLTSGVFHYNPTETVLFFDSLCLSGIPIRPVEDGRRKTGRVLVYYILLEKHRERALGVLKEDSRLQKYKENPVKLICGQSIDPVPSTYQLKKSGDFRSVGSLFKEMGIPTNSNRRSRLHYSNFLTSRCPVRVYQHQSNRSYYFPEKYAGALKNFLRNRYQDLRKSTTV